MKRKLPGERPAKGGAVSKFTPAMRKQILLNLASGCWPSTAVYAAGISRSTWKNWRRQGRAEPKGPFGQFLTQVQEATQQAELSLAAHAVKHAQRDGNVALKMLKQRFPKRWSDKPKVDVTHHGDASAPVTVVLQHDLSALTPQQLDQLHALQAAALKPKPPK